jgi:hypothetical protein
MTVPSLNLAVLPVDEQLRSLVPADMPSSINGIDLRLKMPADSVSTAPANIPSAIGVRNDVMRLS